MKKNSVYYDSYSLEGKTTTNIYEDNDNKSFISFRTILFFILALLVLFSLYRIAISKEPLTFSSLLNTFSNFDTFKIPEFTSSFIENSWGLFDFLRLFLNSIIAIFNIIGFICESMYNLVLFVVKILGWLF